MHCALPHRPPHMRCKPVTYRALVAMRFSYDEFGHVINCGTSLDTILMSAAAGAPQLREADESAIATYECVTPTLPPTSGCTPAICAGSLVVLRLLTCGCVLWVGGLALVPPLLQASPLHSARRLLRSLCFGPRDARPGVEREDAGRPCGTFARPGVPPRTSAGCARVAHGDTGVVTARCRSGALCRRRWLTRRA